MKTFEFSEEEARLILDALKKRISTAYSPKYQEQLIRIQDEIVKALEKLEEK